VVERHLEHAPIAGGQQCAGRSLQPEALDEGEERLPGDGPEDAMEVERREGRQPGEGGERELLGQVPLDVIDDTVDPLLVFETIRVAAQDFRDVFEKNVPTSGRSSRLPHCGHFAPPFSRSLIDRVNDTSFWHLSQKNS
jgi:hypothetical protein